ncbi:TauD/TfdA family dioxygenase [Streptomyces gibsoniae]|uniref:TauD/TfdA family dioxygenase n=1 Tax=Streptomyces gibsoniae TaxID=3075529 RepID=A0ABU2TU20_9ACTN|nr:TauD/TfdA family dioxygenase [Streptomyces sp. DSM 41699]MDT0464463.1 TauD/TfdA family dioxygenase [Streptomyces sp. DSM 41699]
MSNAVQTPPDEDVLALSPSQSTHVRRVCETLREVSRETDDGSWVAAARAAWEDLPPSVRLRVREFRRTAGPSGVLVVRGLPVDEDRLPPTPMVGGSVQRTTSLPAAQLMTFASGLGDPVAYLAEKNGALVQDVVPVPGQEEVQGNTGSVDLMMHNENAFHPHRPDYVLLMCLRADHERVAGLSTASIREALPHLSDGARAQLARAQFATRQPPSFGAGQEPDGEHPVLSGDPADPDIRVDFAATTARALRARLALTELSAALAAVTRTRRLLPGDLAVVDNRICLHGRTAFRPRYDGRDRWLQRTFVHVDLRPSRDHRPEDGHVLTR